MGQESPGLGIGRRELLIGAGLIVATLAVYGQVISHQFINLDDDVSTIALAAVIWLTILRSLAGIQAGYWRDSITLFRHTLLVAPDNLVVHYNLAHALGKQGNLNEAVAHFGDALRIKPDFFDALINIGVTLNDQRRFAEATTYLTRAVELEPASSKAHLQLAIALAQSGSSDEALRHF